MVIEFADDVKTYLEDNMKIKIGFNHHTESINVEIYLEDDLICDSSMHLPTPEISWS